MTLKLLFNPTRCIGCFACEVACKQEHALERGIRWIRVERKETLENDKKPILHFNLKGCEHCDDPPCLPVCPSEAIIRRPDGIVLIDREQCTGCEQCIEACPFGAIVYDPDHEIASKCDLCLDRLEHNLDPNCVTYCQGEAILLSRDG